jgi:dTDP-4-dehydrorhamnose reductase
MTGEPRLTHSKPGGVKAECPRVIVLGGTGMLGHKLFQQLTLAWPETICTVQRKKSDLPFSRIPLFQSDAVIDEVDVSDFERLSRLLIGIRPHVVINCVGVIKQRESASSPIPAITLNSLLPHFLADLSAGWGGRLIHFSTDCVFSGSKGSYKETDSSDARDLYGQTKYLGETAETNALTLRTSIIGRELVNHRSLLDWFLSHRGGKVQGYRKSIYSGLTTNHLAKVVQDIILNHPDLSGVYQIASTPISKYELLCLLKDAYGADIAIEAIDGECCDRSLDGTRFADITGYRCPSWTSLANQLVEDPTPYGKWLHA